MTDLVAAPGTPSAVELATAIAAGERSPVEVVEAALARIAEVQPHLNCFTSVWEDVARAAARAAAPAGARGDELGPLHGVPVAIKDTTPAAGHVTTFGSFAFRDWVADRDAYVVTALRRAGAIIVGQTTTPEFAHTLQTDSPLWGVTRNPHDPTRTPGGSSGGSGAAVASGCVPLAEGSDMGGSVRIPAAWCGVVGLKPSLGRIPMDVLPGLFDTLSHHGPLATTVDDARLFLRATQGPDDADILSIPGPLHLDQAPELDPTALRLGLSIDLGCWAVDPEIAAAVERAASHLEEAGATVELVNPSFEPEDEATWGLLWGVFMATYYGHLVAEHEAHMDPDVLRLIELGNRTTAVEHKQAELRRTSMWRRLAAILAEYDALLCPTMAVPPWPAAKVDRPSVPPPDEAGYHSPDMTAVFNRVSPCPVLSVPVGAHQRPPHAGLPIGMQIVGRRWREDTVLGIGRLVEPTLGG